MDCKTVVVIGSTGDGKSTFLNAFVGSKNTFEEGIGANSVTQKTEKKLCRLQETGEELMLCDTQGLSDSQGLDNNHIKQMVEELKTLDHLNMVVIVINGTNVRFSVYLQETLKLFINIFKIGVLNHLVIVFTHWNITQYDEEKEKRIEKEYNDKFRGMFNVTNNIPCFFLDSCFNRLNTRGKDTYDIEDRDIYTARFKTLYGTLVSMGKLCTEKIAPADSRIESTKVEKRIIEVNRTQTPITKEKKKQHSGIQGAIGIFGNRYYYEQVHVGYTTTVTWREEERQVNTMYSGRVEFENWTTIRQWSTTS